MSKLAGHKVTTKLLAVIGQWLLYIPQGLIIKRLHVFPRVYLCVDIRTNSDYFPIQNKNLFL